MFRFLLKTPTTGLRLSFSRNGAVSATATPSLLYLLHLNSLSTTTTTTTKGTCSSESPISSAHYLVSSLGLSPESALKIPKKKQIHYLKSTSKSNADSVLVLFKAHGFTPLAMAKIFSEYPELLSYDPHRTLDPKLDFFNQIGMSGDTLVDMLTKDPSLLTRSLEGRIIPCINFLKAFFNGNTQSIISLLLSKRGTWIFRDFSESTAPNIESLRAYGLSHSHIVKLFLTCDRYGGCVGRDTEQFNEALRDFSEMGFDLSKPMSVRAFYSFLSMTKDNWVSKMELFKKSFGWTDQQVLALFVKQPTFMTLSEKRLKEAVELFTNRLHWTADDIAKCPRVLEVNLQRKVLRRFSVLEILMSRGLLKRACWAWAYVDTEDAFLRRFVNKYQEHIPNLLEIYQKK